MAKMADIILTAFRELMLNVGTALPGHIASFDPVTQRAQIQPGLQRTTVNGEVFTPEVIIECPVIFSGGTGTFAIEYEINPGDQGLLIVSQRCIDGWKETGGVGAVPLPRFHDLKDACFLPGLRSRAKTLPDFQNNGIRMRDSDGSNYVWLKRDGSIVLKGSGVDIQVESDLTVNGIPFLTHSHAYTWTGSAGSGVTGDPIDDGA